MNKKIFLVASLLLVLGLSSAKAFDTIPLQIAIWPPSLQMVPPTIAVSGLKLNLPYGGNEDIVGLDLGIASTSTNTSALQINLLNMIDQEYAGLQVGIVNLCGSSAGLQIAGIINSTDNKVSGIQIAPINSALEVNGLQIGLVNYTNFMAGVQIGIVNIITDSIVPFFPIINFCF